jgi:transcription antitermination protein NusB
VATSRPHRGGRPRSLARRLAMQALYQWQLTGQPAGEIEAQLLADEDATRCDRDYLHELIAEVTARAQGLDELLAAHADRPVAELDPVEHSILLLGVYELTARLEVPYRVVINEAVELTKRYGATDGHKYVNALLDRIARRERAAERGAPPSRPASA